MIVLPLVAVLLSVTAARSDPSSELTIEPTEFGLAWVNSAENPRGEARIRRGIEAGARLDRFPIYWNRVEPEAGQFQWAGQDTALRTNEQLGLGTLAILLGTAEPYWDADAASRDDVLSPQVGGGPLQHEGEASTQGESECVGTPPPRGLYEPIFADGTDQPAPDKAINPHNPWARFVDRAVRRYMPGGTAGLNVRYWQIWNEPDLCHFFSGSGQDYARLLKVSYITIKRADPDATVIWAGMAHYGPKNEGPDNFLTKFTGALKADPMAAEFGGFFDAAASHQYSNIATGRVYTRRIRAALARTGWEHKPIWITESGVPVCGSFPGPDCPSPHRADAEGQASFIWQNIAITRIENNGGPIFHFMLHDDCGNDHKKSPPADAFGLFTNGPSSDCTPHHAEPRLSYTAFQVAARYFPRTEVIWDDIVNGRVRRVAFYHPETRERRLVLWATGSTDELARVAATGGEGRLVGLDGGEIPLTSKNGVYEIPLPGSTNMPRPDSGTYVGGRPFLLIEEDTLPPTVQMEALPPTSPPEFQLNWSAVDLGSGIEQVEIWIQVNDGPWERWLEDVEPIGQTTVSGSPDQRYRFAVQATDRAGNAHSAPVVFAETRIGEGPEPVTVAGTVHNMKGEPAPGASVRVGPAFGFTNASGRFEFKVPVGRWDVKVEGRLLHQQVAFLADRGLALYLPPVTDSVQNGDFETGVDTGWVQSGRSPVTLERRDGSKDHVLRLASTYVRDEHVSGKDGGHGSNSTITQQVRVPDGKPHLSLFYRVNTEQGEGGQDRFEVIIKRRNKSTGEASAEYLYVQHTASDWRFLNIPLDEYRGEEVELIFNVYRASPEGGTSADIDLVSIGESLTPLGPQHFFLPMLKRKVVSESPAAGPSPTEPASQEDGDTEAIGAAATRHLATETGIDEKGMTVVSIEAQEWPSSALGCPQPEQAYLDAITPGYRVTIEAEGARFNVHTNDDASGMVLCD